MPLPDFSAYTPQGTPGANADSFAANQIVRGANIRATGTLKQEEMQTQFLTQDLPQLQSSMGANGQHYSGARTVAEGNAIRHYDDSQHDLTSGVHNALDELTMAQAYQATGVIS